MHYVGTETAGGFYAFYNFGEGEAGRYSAEMTEDNQTCVHLNFTKKNAFRCPINNTKNYFCQTETAELVENLGRSASGHCKQGVTVDQETGSAIAKGWYDPMYCKSRPLVLHIRAS